MGKQTLSAQILISSHMGKPAMVFRATAHPMLDQVADVNKAVPVAVVAAITYTVGHLLTAQPGLELVANILAFELDNLATFYNDVFFLY